MKSILKTCFLFFVIFFVLCGIVYPFLITGLAEVLFPFQANGSLLQKEGKVIGSKLVGQNYTSDKYFQGRSCTTDVSGGSNLGPTNQSWLNEVKKRIKNIKSKNKLPDHQIVPSDLKSCCLLANPPCCQSKECIKRSNQRNGRSRNEREFPIFFW
jgi:K+-transporting ATPase ATPase C chain